MTLKSVGSKTISNLHIIKAFLYESRKAVALDEIVQHVSEKMEGNQDLKSIKERLVLPILKTHEYFRQVKSNKWEIIEDLMPEYKNIQKVFDKEQAFLLSTEAKSKLATLLDIKSSHIVYDFNRDSRMIKVRGKWGPKDWIIINDKAAELLKEYPQGLTEKEILKLIRERYTKEYENKTIVFHPDKDKRFVKERKVWILSEFKEKEKEREQTSSIAKVVVPIQPERKVSEDLEKPFTQVIVKQTAQSKTSQKPSTSRLIKQKVAEVLSQSKKVKEALEAGKQKETAASVPTITPGESLTSAAQVIAVQDLNANSLFNIEKQSREKTISAKTREEINKLLADLVPESEPLSASELGKGKTTAMKIEQFVLQHYEKIKESRLLVPDKYNRYLIELVKPNLNHFTIIPCVHTGRLMFALFDYLWDSLEDGKWSFGDDDEIKLTLKDNTEYIIDAEDSELIETARDNNLVNQNDLLVYYLDYNFIGIESDPLLTKTARLISAVLGFENAVIFNKDYFSQLPQILGHEPNETNSIEERFDIILGNFLFTNENITANFIDQSMQILDQRGKLGFFVSLDFLQLLPGHPFLRSILAKTRITHVIKLPRESDLTGEINNIVLMVLSGPEAATVPPEHSEVLCAWAEPTDQEQLSAVLAALKKNEKHESINYIEQSKIERKIIDSTKESSYD